MFADWTRAELMQLGTLVVGAAAIAVGAVLRNDIKTIHIMLNSRLSQMLADAEAVGQIKEQDEVRARKLENPPTA